MVCRYFDDLQRFSGICVTLVVFRAVMSFTFPCLSRIAADCAVIQLDVTRLAP
jgi:hypothetical protein